MPTQIKIDMADVRKKLGMVASGMRRGMVVAAAEWLRFTILQSFEQQRSPEGAPWKPLSQNYVNGVLTGGQARRKKRAVIGTMGPRKILGGLKILDRSGALLQSISRGIAIGDDRVTATSSRPYAAAHQFGAVISIPEIRPKKANGVLVFAGPGGAPIFARRTRAHTVRIPARPFLPSPEFAEKEAAKVIEEALQDAINRAGAGQ